jgi:hypothetical protein
LTVPMKQTSSLKQSVFLDVCEMAIHLKLN